MKVEYRLGLVDSNQYVEKVIDTGEPDSLKSEEQWHQHVTNKVMEAAAEDIEIGWRVLKE